MIYLFGFFLLLYILWRIFKPLIIRKAQERYINYINEQARRAFGQQDDPSASGNPFFSSFTGFSGFAGNHNPASPQPPHRRKIFTRDVGEYVEFEELEGTFYSERTSTETFTTESQISDAEWEEIR